MGVTRSTAANRARTQRTPAGRALEFWLMLPVSVLILGGSFLVVKAQSYEMQRAGKPLNLNEIDSSAQIQPLVNFYENPRDRNFALFERITDFLLGRFFCFALLIGCFCHARSAVSGRPAHPLARG